MKAIKKINNNFALCQTESGEEVIVYGKGVGFGNFPCEIPLEKIDRTYYDVNEKYYSILDAVPPEVVLGCSDIADNAAFELDCSLNPNFAFTLADHINFAIERQKKGIDIALPLSHDLKFLYPQEVSLGQSGLDVIERETGIRLPDSEASSIAMHLINAEGEDLHASIQKLEIIDEICSIVEKELGVQINKESYSYSRFAVHLHNLIRRLEAKEPVHISISTKMLRTMAMEYPDVYFCGNRIIQYLDEKWGWKCNEEELLYIMLHVSRIRPESN